LRTPVVLGHWLVNKRGPAAVQRGRKPLRIPTGCVEHKSRLWATANHLRLERRRGQGLVRLVGEPGSAMSAVWSRPLLLDGARPSKCGVTRAQAEQGLLSARVKRIARDRQSIPAACFCEPPRGLAGGAQASW
jgi:hypothetical protein